MKFNLPNSVSAARIVLAPIFYVLLMKHSPVSISCALIIFTIAALTDWADGWLARKYGEVTSWGVFIDPLADKVLTAAAFIAFSALHLIPSWMVVIMLLRDIFMTLMRMYADKIDLPVKTSKSAKTKTFLQMIFIVFVLLGYFVHFVLDVEHSIFAEPLFLNPSLVWSLMFALTLFTAWTAIEYLFDNRLLFTTFVRSRTSILKKHTHFHPLEKAPQARTVENNNISFSVRQTLAIMLGSGFGLGFIPKAPGTAASFAVVITAIAYPQEYFVWAILAVVSFIVGVWASSISEQALVHDPSLVVIDEISAMFLLLSSPFIPNVPTFVVLSFVLFRFFDIAKPFPVNYFQKKDGGFAIMIDDTIASLMVLVITHVFFIVYQTFFSVLFFGK